MSDSYIALVEKSIDERTQQYQELLQLRDENERLRKALRPFALKVPNNIDGNTLATVRVGDLRRARAALEGVTEP